MIAGGCEEVALEAEVTNLGALRLYERLGFVRDKRLQRWVAAAVLPRRALFLAWHWLQSYGAAQLSGTCLHCMHPGITSTATTPTG
jgi:hypothetical protein